jgi:hypothetical protein
MNKDGDLQNRIGV